MWHIKPGRPFGAAKWSIFEVIGGKRAVSRREYYFALKKTPFRFRLCKFLKAIRT